MSHPLVKHVNRSTCDVYIGRGSKWGNPFVIGRHGNRAEVIAKFEAYLQTKPELIAALPELRGQNFRLLVRSAGLSRRRTSKTGEPMTLPVVWLYQWMNVSHANRRICWLCKRVRATQWRFKLAGWHRDQNGNVHAHLDKSSRQAICYACGTSKPELPNEPYHAVK